MEAVHLIADISYWQETLTHIILYETVHLSPPSGGGPEVAICFSIFSFLFLFCSTDWASKIPRDAASFCLLSAASASFALFSSGSGEGGSDSPGQGRHSPMGTAAAGPCAGRPVSAHRTARPNARPTQVGRAPGSPQPRPATDSAARLRPLWRQSRRSRLRP